ncbi:hypothetical protein EJB05_23138, partial [Eragrostis curvula]
MAEALMAPASLAPAPGVPGEECRINALPKDVLLRALSHLDTLEVVQTCVLSRQWRDLWRSVPSISATHKAFDVMEDTAEEYVTLFKAFVNRFLMLRNPIALDEFNLGYYVHDDDGYESMDYDAESEDANLWIGHALQCNARSIHVSVDCGRLYLDSSVFTSNFLNSLKLSSVALFHGFFANLQRDCTVLERLRLSNCYIEDVEICSQTLKVFTIDSLCDFQCFERATISIPSLVHLRYYLSKPIPLLLPNMESLKTASVSVHDTTDIPVDDICQVASNVQWCPKFNNLTILRLGELCLYGDFYALIVFLQNSPNLVKLTLKLRKRPGTDTAFRGDLKERSFTCEHLRIVKIICSEESKAGAMFNNLQNLLTENGITPGQIDIIR